MFERFTEEARRVVVLAQDEARGLEHDWIGTEHLLLGLLREETGLAAQVLGSFDVTLAGARAEVTRLSGGRSGRTSGAIPFTPSAKRVLESSLREALALSHASIATEHLLLGLADELHGVAARVLAAFGADAERVRAAVMGELARSGPQGGVIARGFGFGEPPLPSCFPPAPTLWDYHVLALDDLAELTVEWLTELGGEGWELVGSASEPGRHRFVFKRPRRSFQAPPEAAG